MSQARSTFNQPQRTLVVDLIAYAIAFSGILIIASTLPTERFINHLHVGFNLVPPAINLFIGLGLLYLSVHIRRRKKTAWILSTTLLSILLVFSLERLVPFDHMTVDHFGHLFVQRVVINILVPIAILIGLFTYREQFTVRSDIRSFTLSLRIVILVLAAAFIYGVSGYLLLDKHDFHKEIGLGEAMHHTIDQFGLTTSSTLTPHTGRARAFVDSLSIISLGAVGYAVISLFQPIRVRLSDQGVNREKAHELLDRYPASSEDFFKLWPKDKLYFFNGAQTAGLAYHVYGGVALVVGDPFGDRGAFDTLLEDFDELCATNDWTAAFIHTERQYSDFYKQHDLALQKIGEEAILDIAAFRAETIRNKYFRQIRNKFTKQGYTTEVLMPPHNDTVMRRLSDISAEWLAQPGRDERGFMMGYFSARYMQACPIMVLRDGDGTIQGFINQILSFDKEEANFDLLRQSKASLGNSNDFLLMGFIEYAHEKGFQRLNLGLCPLAGLAAQDEERSVVDNALRFVYANGDRFYSFSGLHRFKAKYEPHWDGRYIAYRGGIGNFTRVLNALNRAMRVRSSHYL